MLAETPLIGSIGCFGGAITEKPEKERDEGEVKVDNVIGEVVPTHFISWQCH